MNLNGDTVTINTDLADPNQRVTVDRKSIEEMQVSKVSAMPKELLNRITKDEIMDLVAYVLSGGKADHQVFQSTVSIGSALTMRILCFSDLHRDQQAATNLVGMAAEVELVIGAGDFANRHQGLADTLDILAAIAKPTVLVPGNGETESELRDASAKWASAMVLHGGGFTLPEGSSPTPIEVWGVGGGIPVTPFGDWSYDFDEDAGEQMLADCPSGGILVTHSPPLDTVDHDSSGKIRGSRAIRDCVEKCRPRLVVCGHIHSDWEKQVQLGDSLVLNAGPRGVIVDVAF